MSLSVLGAGSWGTALALLAARNGCHTLLWGHDPAHIATLRAERENRRYLPGFTFPPGLQLTDDLAHAATFCDTVLLVVPSHAFTTTLQALQRVAIRPPRIAWATKGFNPEDGRFLHQVVEAVYGADWPTAALSGPTFAREVAAGLPTAVTLASQQTAFAEELAAILHNPCFRVYTSSDLIGVQAGGAIKNVLAIAAGIADGLGYGANTRAALITRGLAEIMRLGLALGGRTETFVGLAGLGDLVLTCTDDQSRNRRYGLALGKGQAPSDIIVAIGQEVEGIFAAKETYRLACRHGIDMPITEQTYHVLHGDLSPRDAVMHLLEREKKAEI